MSNSNVKSPPPRRRTSTEKRTAIRAAIRCFKKFGASRTSMSDIALEAGISRKKLYRTLVDRPTLVQQVLLTLFGRMRHKIADRMSSIEDTHTAFIEGLLISVDVVQGDRLFNEILRDESNSGAEQMIVRGNEAIRSYMVEFWGPIVEKGRKEGLIRASLSDEEVFELLTSLHGVMVLRGEPKGEQRRAHLTNMLRSVFID